MSVEQINLMQAFALVPTIILLSRLFICCISFWFGCVGLFAIYENLKGNKINLKGASEN